MEEKLKDNSFSIIIPCRNEEHYIANCIQSILDNHYNDGLEIIVCDGCSSDNTQKIVREFQLENPNIRLIVNEKQTTQFALNLGIENSNGNYVMILGAHSMISPTYLVQIAKVFDQNPDVACVGGLLENYYENNVSEAIGKAMSSVFGVGNAHFRTGTKAGLVDTVAFGTYKREVFDKIGLFDIDLARNQDDEFNYRMFSNGLKMFLEPNIIAKYFVRASFKKLFKQYFQYGFWKVFVNKKHKTITTFRQLIPLFFVLFLIFSLGMAVVFPISLFVIIPILGLYFLGSIYFAFKQSSKFNEVLLICYSFLILHLSYGYGYLWGIIWFIIFQQKIKDKHHKMTR